MSWTQLKSNFEQLDLETVRFTGQKFVVHARRWHALLRLDLTLAWNP